MAIPDIKNRESLMKIGKALMENRESLMTIAKVPKQPQKEALPILSVFERQDG